MSELAFVGVNLRTRVAPHGSVSSRIRDAARRLGWSYSRTKDLWYEDPCVSVKPRELRKIEEYTGVSYGREEVSEIDALITRADALLDSQDPNLRSAVAIAVRAIVGALAGTGTGEGR